MFRSAKGVALLAVVAFAAGAILYFGWYVHGGWPTGSSACCLGQRQTASSTLDPSLFRGEAAAAYEVARRDPGLLAQIHCYCGCDRDLGHRSLLDCYRTRHGSQCPICIGEAIEAERMEQQGVPIEEIRDALRTRYSHGS